MRFERLMIRLFVHRSCTVINLNLLVNVIYRCRTVPLQFLRIIMIPGGLDLEFSTGKNLCRFGLDGSIDAHRRHIKMGAVDLGAV
jgi:hypothetical protein